MMGGVFALSRPKMLSGRTLLGTSRLIYYDGEWEYDCSRIPPASPTRNIYDAGSLCELAVLIVLII